MSCTFKTCRNTRRTCKNNFFNFPSLPYMRKQWLEACKIMEEELPKAPLVCSAHFKPSDICLKQQKVRLAKSAVPTIGSLQVNVDNENLEKYLEHLEGNQEIKHEVENDVVSQKIMRNLYTSVSTQTSVSLDENAKLKLQIHYLEKTIEKLECQLGELRSNLQEKNLVFTPIQCKIFINNPKSPRLPNV